MTMSLPLRTLCTVALTLGAFAAGGCSTGTIYTDVYSPKRQRFVAVPEKKEAPLLETVIPPAIPDMPPPPAMPSMPTPDAAPPIPADGAMPGMAPEPIPALPG